MPNIWLRFQLLKFYVEVEEGLIIFGAIGKVFFFVIVMYCVVQNEIFIQRVIFSYYG